MFVDPLQVVQRVHLSDVIARQLESAILGGQYLPGERLPAQRQLAKDLGVSRPVLRESLQILELRGLIVTYHRSGTYVAGALNISNSPVSWLRDNLSRVRQFYEFRQIIEPPGAALAAGRATTDEIKALKRNLDEATAIIEKGDIRPFVALDIEFHALVAQMSHNPYLLHVLNQNISLEADVRQVIHLLPGHLAVAHQRHISIYDAIAAGDADLSSQLMLDALVRVLQEIGDVAVV